MYGLKHYLLYMQTSILVQSSYKCGSRITNLVSCRSAVRTLNFLVLCTVRRCATFTHLFFFFIIPKNPKLIYVSGGSFCNIMAIHLAKLKYDPTLKQKGVFSIQPMVLLTSEDAHYSIAKGANFLGFGTDSIIKVKTDDKGRVKPDDLENKIQQCKQNVSL